MSGRPNPKKVTAKYIEVYLTTKSSEYPDAVLRHVRQVPWMRIHVYVNQPCPATQFELAVWARSRWVYIQDDDCRSHIPHLLRYAKRDRISCLMPAHYMSEYAASPCALLGWGAIIPTQMLFDSIRKYQAVYSRDEVFCREASRIVSALNFPQVRLESPVDNMPWATAPDRLSMQPEHYQMRDEALRRCAELLKNDKAYR